jgi:hypothetical protein
MRDAVTSLRAGVRRGPGQFGIANPSDSRRSGAVSK